MKSRIVSGFFCGELVGSPDFKISKNRMFLSLFLKLPNKRSIHKNEDASFILEILNLL
jgi:hypothetical protein